MKTKKATNKLEARNWVLVFIASILIVIGLVLAIISVAYAGAFGWWSVLIGIGGVVTVVASVMSIVKNDPSWILLNLLLPG